MLAWWSNARVALFRINSSVPSRHASQILYAHHLGYSFRSIFICQDQKEMLGFPVIYGETQHDSGKSIWVGNGLSVRTAHAAHFPTIRLASSPTSHSSPIRTPMLVSGVLISQAKSGACDSLGTNISTHLQFGEFGDVSSMRSLAKHK